MRAAMGKSVGTKPSGKGPGMQKRMTSQRKYLVSDKNKVKKGSMADLDFGVEQAPKLSKAEQETGLKGKTAAPAARPAPAAAEPAPKKAKSAMAVGTKTTAAAKAAAAAAAAAVETCDAASHEAQPWQVYKPEGKGDRACLAERVGAVHYGLAVNVKSDYEAARSRALSATHDARHLGCIAFAGTVLNSVVHAQGSCRAEDAGKEAQKVCAMLMTAPMAVLEL